MTTGLDVEAVLRMHLGDGSDDCAECCACATVDEYVAHVAAVFRVEIETALGDAWDEGYEAGVQDIDAAYSAERFTDTPNPYRASLAATEGG